MPAGNVGVRGQAAAAEITASAKAMRESAL
jgi:hypothetical protein